jgi:all-trans-retinol 13,14-reductase
METHSYDFLVAGSGISGMTLALLMARQGRKVAVLEQGPASMPLIRRWNRLGVWCDAGLHYSGGLGKGQSLEVLFGFLGAPVLRSRMMGPQTFDRITLDGRDFDMPIGLDALEQALAAWFPGAGAAGSAYVGLCKKMLAEVPYLNFELSFSDFSTEYRSQETLQDFLARQGAPQPMIDLLGLMGFALCGVHAHEVPVYVSALILGPFFQEPRVLLEGGDEVADALTRRAEELGVDVFCNAAVAHLEVSSERCFQAFLTEDGRRFEAPSAAVTFHPRLLEKMLPSGAVRPAYLSRLRDLPDTPSIFSVYFKADEVPAQLKKGNHYQFMHKADGAWDLLGVMCCQEEEGMPRALCLTLPDSKDRPGTGQYPGPEYEAWKEKRIAEGQAQLENMYPQLKGKLEVACAASGLTFERYTRTCGGSAYGLKHSAHEIPLGPVTSVRGLYLAGQGIHFPGLLGCVISAFLTGGMLLGLENLWDEVTAWKREKFS